MALAKGVKGTKVLIQIGDGADPEVFAHPCLISTTRGIQFTSTTSDINLPDCDSPDAPAWLGRVVDGLSAQITGEGALHVPNVDTFWSWFTSGESKNIRANIDAPAADGGGYWEMKAVLTGFNVNGDRNNYAQASVTIASDGLVTWVPAV